MKTITPVGLLKHVPMTVRWVLAVMLVTTLVATHSHSPWSSLLRARNCRLPLGSALCLLLLGFPTLAKQGAGKRTGAGIQFEVQVLTLRSLRRTKMLGQPLSPLPTPPLSDSVAPLLTSDLSTQFQVEPQWLFPDSPTGRELQSPGTFLQVMTGKGSPAAAQGMSSSRPASCLYSQPGSTVKYGGS